MGRATASRAFALAVLWLCLAGRAQAADPAEDARAREADRLITKLDASVAAGKRQDVERALPRLVKLHNELKSASVRGKLLKAAGRVMATASLGATRTAAATALQDVNDPKAAWKELKRFMPSVKVVAAGPFPLGVVQSVGVLAPDGALPTLLQLMGKAKDDNVARYAIQALGKYGWSKQRVRVLGALLSYLKRLRPGGTNIRKGKAGGAASRGRYQFLRATLVAALDELTGRKFAEVDKWLAAYKEHKRKLDALFTFKR